MRKHCLQTSCVAMAFAMLPCASLADTSHAGFSGPGGPRLNYDAPPIIAPYEPRPEPKAGEKNINSDPASQKPKAVNPRAVVPSDTHQPNRTAPRRGQAGRENALTPNAAPSRNMQGQRAPATSPRVAQPKAAPRSSTQQRNDILKRLYIYLSDAKTKDQGQRLSQSIERIWLQSDSPTTELLMRRADRAIETGRWAAAQTFVDAVVKLQPGYTEGLMRRAMLNFQRQRPTTALRDLKRVLVINPNHFVALDRVGAILQTVGEDKSALEAFKKLKRIHPQAPGLDKRIEELTRKIEGEQI